MGRLLYGSNLWHHDKHDKPHDTEAFLNSAVTWAKLGLVIIQDASSEESTSEPTG